MRVCFSLMTPKYTNLTPMSIDTIMVSQGGVVVKRITRPPCSVCGKPTKRSGRPYCSRECGNIWKRKDPYRFGPCPVCGEPLKVKGALTCSIVCREKSPAHQEKMRVIAEKQREALKGENNPFWGRTHSEETRQILKTKNTGAEVPEERRKKISQSLLGYRHTDEAREKMRIQKEGREFPSEAIEALKRWREDATEEEKQARFQADSLRKKAAWAKLSPEERRKRMQPLIEKAMQTKISSIEMAVCGILDDLGIEYIPQYPIRWYFADIYIPKLNLIIECDGDYWHDYQRFPRRKQHDEARDKRIRGMGYTIVRIKEKDIRLDARSVTLQALGMSQ